MKFAEKLLKHPEFLQLQKRVQEMEQDRIYCHHELSHALDVCRMAWMMYLEDEYKTHLKDYRQKKINLPKNIVPRNKSKEFYSMGN